MQCLHGELWNMDSVFTSEEEAQKWYDAQPKEGTASFHWSYSECEL